MKNIRLPLWFWFVLIGGILLLSFITKDSYLVEEKLSDLAGLQRYEGKVKSINYCDYQGKGNSSNVHLSLDKVRHLEIRVEGNVCDTVNNLYVGEYFLGFYLDNIPMQIMINNMEIMKYERQKFIHNFSIFFRAFAPFFLIMFLLFIFILRQLNKKGV